MDVQIYITWVTLDISSLTFTSETEGLLDRRGLGWILHVNILQLPASLGCLHQFIHFQEGFLQGKLECLLFEVLRLLESILKVSSNKLRDFQASMTVKDAKKAHRSVKVWVAYMGIFLT